jgi:hypothetical protein
MAGALEAVDADGVDAHPLGRQGVADGGALVDHLDAVGLELIDVLLRLITRGLDDLDPGLDDRGAVLGIGRRLDGRQDGQVHAKRLVGELAGAGDLLGQGLGRRLGQGGEKAQGSGVGHGADQGRGADPLHAALGDRMLDAEHLGEAGLDGHGRAPSDFGEYGWVTLGAGKGVKRRPSPYGEVSAQPTEGEFAELGLLPPPAPSRRLLPRGRVLLGEPSAPTRPGGSTG